MSEFDAYESAFAGDLVSRLGDADAVEHQPRTVNQKTKYPAIVGRLKTVRIETIRGNQQVEEDWDQVQVSVKCPPGVVGINDHLAVFEHMSDAAGHYDSQRFIVTSVDSISGVWTTVMAGRKSLAMVRQRGSSESR